MAIKSNVLLLCDTHNSVLEGRGGVSSYVIAYNAFGWRQTVVHGPALGFNGQRVEPQTQWYCLGHGHRVYNSMLMRFHSPDRLSPFDKGGLSAYGYCSADPVNYEDPTGKYVAKVAGALDFLGNLTSHAENLTGSLLLSRPQGVLGYAAWASNVGYTSAVSGVGLTWAGYHAAGEVMSNVGISLIAAGNGLRSAHRVVQAVKGSRLASIVRRRLQIRRASEGPLVHVVVGPS